MKIRLISPIPLKDYRYIIIVLLFIEHFYYFAAHEKSAYRARGKSLPSIHSSDKTVFATKIADAVNAQGGMVGRIKLIMQEPGRSCRISVTDHDPDVLDLNPSGTHVDGAAIVLLVEKSWFAKLMKESVQSLL